MRLDFVKEDVKSCIWSDQVCKLAGTPSRVLACTYLYLQEKIDHLFARQFARLLIEIRVHVHSQIQDKLNFVTT